MIRPTFSTESINLSIIIMLTVPPQPPLPHYHYHYYAPTLRVNRLPPDLEGRTIRRHRTGDRRGEGHSKGTHGRGHLRMSQSEEHRASDRLGAGILFSGGGAGARL